MPAVAKKETPPSKELAEILEVLNGYGDAHRNKDAAGILSFYAKDAVVFDLSPPLRSRLVGSPEGMQEWLDTWDGPIEIEPRDFAFNVSGDVAYGYGYLRMKGAMKSGGEAVDFWMRSSVGLRREGGRWRIVHEHTSVPFHMDGSFRPAFDLTP